MGCHFLLQGIFWTQGLNPGLCIVGRFFYQGSLCKALVIGKMWDKKESTLVVFRSWGRGVGRGNGNLVFNGDRISVRKLKNSGGG